MTNTHRFTIFTAACAAMLLSSCGKKTEAELAEEEREKLRQVKRENAVKYYKVLANDFVGHPKSNDAADRARALESQAPKK